MICLPAVVFAVYELVFEANAAFHHNNARLPVRVERLLNRLLATPRMHGIHHSQVQRETNSNYGVVFPWWDWLHRSLPVTNETGARHYVQVVLGHSSRWFFDMRNCCFAAHPQQAVFDPFES